MRDKPLYPGANTFSTIFAKIINCGLPGGNRKAETARETLRFGLEKLRVQDAIRVYIAESPSIRRL
jgi:hypothetical protein